MTTISNKKYLVVLYASVYYFTNTKSLLYTKSHKILNRCSPLNSARDMIWAYMLLPQLRAKILEAFEMQRTAVSCTEDLCKNLKYLILQIRY